MKILTICPSIYPEKLDVMLKSYELTRSKYNNIIVCSNGTVTEAINNCFKNNPDYDYYHITNDDVDYLTPLWDISLARSGEISYGNDLFQGENLCTFPMIDGNIARAIGWLQLPTLNRYCGDVVWKFIGKELGILRYIPNVVIRHRWLGCNNQKIHSDDMLKFSKWLQTSHNDLEKVRKVLCQE